MSNKNETDQVKNLLVEEEILWKDRKRYLGLPISFTIYSLDNNRFYVKRGFFNSVMDELLLYRVLDVKLTRSLGQKIFGVGTIMLMTADQSNPSLYIKNVRHSDRVRKLLSNIVERERNEKRIMGKEMYGASGMGIMDEVDLQEHNMNGLM
ncbi:MAG: PH domain-containing protein [Eubacteriales bacterium]